MWAGQIFLMPCIIGQWATSLFERSHGIHLSETKNNIHLLFIVSEFIPIESSKCVPLQVDHIRLMSLGYLSRIMK